MQNLGKVTAAEREREREISASADGGPRFQVCARETLRSALHRRVCRVTFVKFPHFPVKIWLFWGVGGSPKFFYWNPPIFVT